MSYDCQVSITCPQATLFLFQCCPAFKDYALNRWLYKPEPEEDELEIFTPCFKSHLKIGLINTKITISCHELNCTFDDYCQQYVPEIHNCKYCDIDIINQAVYVKMNQQCTNSTCQDFRSKFKFGQADSEYFESHNLTLDFYTKMYETELYTINGQVKIALDI